MVSQSVQPFPRARKAEIIVLHAAVQGFPCQRAKLVTQGLDEPISRPNFRPLLELCWIWRTGEPAPGGSAASVGTVAAMSAANFRISQRLVVALNVSNRWIDDASTAARAGLECAGTRGSPGAGRGTGEDDGHAHA
jgi:hypothetical protein